MDYTSLIPVADSIPAPAWLFVILEQLIFLLHIVLINAVLGGALIMLFGRNMEKDSGTAYNRYMPVAAQLPVMVALAINLGVPPLLFMQVVFGHLFYTSSVLMAVYWIMIIPLLILAYYAIYIHKLKFLRSPLLSKLSLGTAILFILYIGYIQVANNALMEQPESWTAYFAQRGGTFLNSTHQTFLPRYLHFIVSSVAIGGLLFALVFHFRKETVEKREESIRRGLRIFALATAVQVVVGCWYLLTLPREFILQFMGRNALATFFLLAGAVCGTGAMVTAWSGQFKTTILLTLATLAAMIITRYQLRIMYLNDHFSVSELTLNPQYGVMALFLIILVAGLVVIGYMLKVGFNKTERSAA
ncbi:MAG TPA: hypothetical protein PLX49_09435 [Prolixibacteraceae bacterium]|nr:hypothetical protein [Prolixibacteraceae bacterium]HOY51977.1 hypothetical protein [Prolixibacteraceae bacterium]